MFFTMKQSDYDQLWEWHKEHPCVGNLTFNKDEEFYKLAIMLADLAQEVKELRKEVKEIKRGLDLWD